VDTAGIVAGHSEFEFSEIRDRFVQNQNLVRVEKGRIRERSCRRVVDFTHRAVVRDSENSAVERNHFAVERVESADSEIAIFPNRPERSFAVENSGEQCVDRRGLKNYIAVDRGGRATRQNYSAKNGEHPRRTFHLFRVFFSTCFSTIFAIVFAFEKRNVKNLVG